MRLIMMRHSYANYEAAFMSHALTQEGIECAQRAAEKIIELVGETPARVGSSPAKRALATATHLCRALNIPFEYIQPEPELADTMVYDLKGRNEFFRRSLAELKLADLHELDGRYMAGDARFNEYPELFEPRHAVANRVFGWLGRHVQEFYEYERKYLLIEVTHAEVINVMLAGFGILEPVRQCEILDMRFTLPKLPGMVSIEAHFRGAAMRKDLKVPARIFGEQFGDW